jgi:hypothetical protein
MARELIAKHLCREAMELFYVNVLTVLYYLEVVANPVATRAAPARTRPVVAGKSAHFELFVGSTGAPKTPKLVHDISEYAEYHEHL